MLFNDNIIVEIERRDYIMYYKTSPKYLFIIYTIDLENGNFTPCIQSSIPFNSREDAEVYMEKFVNNIEDKKSTLFAIIPAE